jgi:succinoglycan biosynthesis protein ExoL
VAGRARIAMVLSNGLASDPRVEKEAEALVAAGYDVTVFAWDRSGSLPACEERRGFSIERMGPLARHGAGVRNIFAYRAFWAEAADRIVELAPDAVHCHDLDTALVGLRVRRSLGTRIKLVLDFHELYRESNMVPQRGIAGVVARAAVRLVETRALRVADAVVVVNPVALDYNRRLAAGPKLVTVENAPDAEMFRPYPGPRPERPFTVGFMGQKRYLADLAALVEAVRRNERLAALLAGGGTAADDVARLSSGVDRIEVRGPFRYAELPELYRRCDAIFALYDAPIGNVLSAIPVKMMEAMACGLPVLVAAGTASGEFAEQEGVGIAIQGADVDALEAALLRLADEPGLAQEMGRRGRAIVDAGLNWEAASRRLVDTYAVLLAR